jgi:leucyl-tRNA synthetase
LLEPSEVSLAVLVNEKIVDRITVDLDAPKTQVIEQALKLKSVQARTGGRPADRVVHVPDRLLKLIYSDVITGAASESPEAASDAGSTDQKADQN